MKQRLPMVAAGGAILVAFLIGILWIRDQLSKPIPKGPEKVQVVNVVRPPPPPPKEEPPPPPPEMEEEVEVPEPTETPDEQVADSPEPPAGDLLGLDADGIAGGDAFGLAARRGGRSILAGGGGGGGDRYYFSAVENALRDRLSGVEELRRANYEIPAALSFDGNGCVRLVTLESSTGDEDRDALLREQVEGICVDDERTAKRMASQTIRLRIASR
jgi:hypothetical protein